MNAIRRLPRALAAAAVSGCLLSLAAPAAAQDAIPATNGGGFDLRLFRPAVDSKGQFTVNGTDILGAGDLSFGFVGDFGLGLLRAGSPDDRALVDSYISGALQANVGIANLLVIGAQLPIQLVSGPGRPLGSAGDSAHPFNGIGRNLYNPSNTGLNYQGLGDITVHAKLRWLRAEYFPVGLAIIVQGGFNPQAGWRNFAGEPSGFVWPSAALEWRPARRWRVDLNLGARIPFAGGSEIRRQNGPGTTYGPSLTYGAGVSWRAIDVLDLVAETYGQAYLTGLGDVPASLPMEGVLGAKVFVQRNSYLMFGAGTRLVPGGFAAADFRAFVGIIFEPSIGDTDGDGYRDDVDQCITDPEDFDNFQDDDGCSDPDNDRDGLLDVDDQCPIIPEDRDGDQDQDGCPEGQESDRDGDGILDQADRCADEPEDRDGFQDQDGCPDPDNDEDQILDTIDNCPNDAEDRDDWEDDDGCPDPDNDHDNILDTVDQCRNDPEVLNGVEDDDGCPDTGSLVIIGTRIELREQIQFETDSAEIRPISFPIVEQMANLLRRNPQIELLEIEGHTDERGDDEHNLRLSADRANSVMQALIQRGIAPNRLVAAGYGEYCPQDPGHNPRAWERNRRVQFLIVRTRDEGRTTGVAGCRRAAHLIPAIVGPPGTGVAREVSQPAPGGSAPAPNAPPPNAPAPAAPAGGTQAPAPQASASPAAPQGAAPTR
jgi:outer membrane protein OmpA-like peptidoglycan-associated protein